jgi:hypothetical protein
MPFDPGREAPGRRVFKSTVSSAVRLAAWTCALGRDRLAPPGAALEMVQRACDQWQDVGALGHHAALDVADVRDRAANSRG